MIAFSLLQQALHCQNLLPIHLSGAHSHFLCQQSRPSMPRCLQPSLPIPSSALICLRAGVIFFLHINHPLQRQLHLLVLICLMHHRTFCQFKSQNKMFLQTGQLTIQWPFFLQPCLGPLCILIQLLHVDTRCTATQVDMPLTERSYCCQPPEPALRHN